MVTVYIHNVASPVEVYRNKSFKIVTDAFDYVYEHERGLMFKGGWVAKVCCSDTGKVLIDERHTSLA